MMSESDKQTVSCRSLLIGGAGFIGSHLAQRLADSGRHVTVFDRHQPDNIEFGQSITFAAGDFTDSALMKSLVAEHDEVVHLAYATVPNTSFDDPLADLTQNLPPSVQLFDLVARNDKKLLLVSSGGTVYGEAEKTPQSEEHPTRPISPYGVTKLTLEKYAHLYAVTRGLKVICVRPANPYGEGQRPYVGQGFVATAMASAMQGRPVTIFGEQGTVRDYIHIDDLVEGMVTVLDHGRPMETYNIGSSTGLSNLEVLQAMQPLLREVGAEMQIEHASARPFDVKVNILDCTKLRQLGWWPKIGLEQGLRRTRDWVRKELV